MKFDKCVRKVKAAVAPRELNLFDGEVREVTKANDGLSGGEKHLCENTDDRRDD